MIGHFSKRKLLLFNYWLLGKSHSLWLTPSAAVLSDLTVLRCLHESSPAGDLKLFFRHV